MRVFNFKARNIGEEKYLTYTMGEDCELDEDVLDYCEENNLKELIDIIYEEDDDYDYLTYDITGKTSLEEYIGKEMKAEQVLLLVRNVASNLIDFKEQSIQLSYILLNRSYIYVGEKMELQYICLPIESKAAVAVEFKSFIRQLLANMRYNVDEELGYVGKLLTYINGESFNLRGLIGLAEALMEEIGLIFEEAGAIEADGVEVVNRGPELKAEETKISEFMSDIAEGETLPEIGDDEEDEEDESDEELESVLPAGMETSAEKEIPTISESSEADTPVVAVEEKTEANKEVEGTSDAEETEDDADVDRKEAADSQVEAEGISDDASEDEHSGAIVKKLVNRENTKSGRPKKTLGVNVPGDAGQSKETDIDLIKSRIKELVGEVPALRTTSDSVSEIKTIDDLDNALGKNKPPVIKKNVVKVNRAALIQSAAEHEGETEKLEGPDPINVAESEAEVEEEKVEELETEAAEANAEEKPKSNSILSKTVLEVAKNTLMSSTPKATPYLIRVNTEERIMLGKVVFKIGKASRGVDYTVGGNGAISRQHAVIMQKEGVCYIKDNKSTNHTYVNDKMVEDGVEEILTHDSKIRLGDEEFIFKIR